MSHDLSIIAARLRQDGYRMTPQRQFILDAICASGGHVSPEEVYQQIQAVAPTLNRATIYRTLNFLAGERIIAATQQPDGRLVYEIARPEPHHHLVCRQCGGSIELPHTALGTFIQAMESQYNFCIDMDHISLFGLCARCCQDE